MDKYIYNEQNELWYELQGDYYLPCLKLPEEEALDEVKALIKLLSDVSEDTEEEMQARTSTLPVCSARMR